MLDSNNTNVPRPDDFQSSAAEYLRRAKEACNAGDSLLGMHLYLAAFEKAAKDSSAPSEEALVGLRNAWALALDKKERALAEYIFEKMEPYLTSDEIASCAEELQRLAFDKLQEFGLTQEAIEDMTDLISQDYLGIDLPYMQVDGVFTNSDDQEIIEAEALDAESLDEVVDDSEDETTDLLDDDASSAEDQGLARSEAKRDEREQEESGSGQKPKKATSKTPKKSSQKAIAFDAREAIEAYLSRAAESAGKVVTFEVPENYSTLAGYDSVISLMRDFGIGLKDDREFNDFVRLLNNRHGLDRMPAADTLLFRSPVREDANRFLNATVGELRLPTVRMHMEENLQGLPVLCVTAQAEDPMRLSALRNSFSGGGVLVLEDIDLWGSPLTEMSEEMGGFLMMQLSRGAREAINMISSAVENQDVYVLASASSTNEVDSFFLDILEPLSLIDIDYPNVKERLDIWTDIARQHPSMRAISRVDLVRLSANLARYDIYMAAREALEEAYKLGLMTREYRPVTRQNLFDKLAAYQALDSKEYQEIEDEIVKDFQDELNHIDDLLDESEG